MSSLSGADAKLIGGLAGQQAGFRVGPAGDLDGDGFQDVIVGAFLDGTTGPSAGAAYVVYGPLSEGPLNLAGADAKLLAELTGDFAGEGWAGVGDLDADGFDDFVIGAPGRFPPNQPGVPAPGAAYVFYGGQERLSGTMSLATADAKLVGESAVDFAGLAVSSATDLDGDGFADLVVSAPRDFAGGSVPAGTVSIFYGGQQRLSGTVSLAQADAKLVGSPGDLAGFRLDRAGDLDGDGSQDLVIGAPAIAGFGGTGIGATYVLYGSQGRLGGTIGLSGTAARLVGEDNDDRPGIGMSGAGDLDGDGLDDLVVGADLEDSAGLNSGAAYVFYGSQNRLTGTVNLGTSDAKLIGEAAGDQAGAIVSLAGDLDDDGFGELAVGAQGQDAAGANAGAAYVFFGEDGRLSGDLSLFAADAKLLGEAAGDAVNAVGPAGDVTDDDTDDLMVGSRFNDAGGPDAGAVYVLFGKPETCGLGHLKDGDNPGNGPPPCDP